MSTRLRTLLDRLGYILLCLFLLLLLQVPIILLVLASRQEITWQRSPFDSDRLWLIQSVEASGLGFSHTHLMDGAPDGRCARTDTTIWIYAGRPRERGWQRTAYCECYQPVNGQWQGGGRCQLP